MEGGWKTPPPQCYNETKKPSAYRVKLRINAGNKEATNAQDKAIADVYGNKFIIPLDFEMLDSAAPYYQAGIGNRLCYELTFNDYNRVTKSRVSLPKVPDA